MILTTSVVLTVLPLAVLKATRWYSERCVSQSKNIVNRKLREFEAIAQQYTKNGTPDEMLALMGELEDLMDELQTLETNNLKRE